MAIVCYGRGYWENVSEQSKELGISFLFSLVNITPCLPAASDINDSNQLQPFPLAWSLTHCYLHQCLLACWQWNYLLVHIFWSISTEPGVTLSVNLQIWSKQIIRIVNRRDQMLLHLKGTRFWILFFFFLSLQFKQRQEERWLPRWFSDKELCLLMQEMQERQVPSLGREDPLEKEMAPCSSILAWEIPWTEETDGLQSMGSQRVGHEWAQEERCWYHDANTAVLYYWWGIWYSFPN